MRVVHRAYGALHVTLGLLVRDNAFVLPIYRMGTPGVDITALINTTHDTLAVHDFFSSTYDEDDGSDVLVIPYVRVVMDRIARTKKGDHVFGMLPPTDNDTTHGCAPMWGIWDVATFKMSHRGGAVYPGVYEPFAFDDTEVYTTRNKWEIDCTPVSGSCFCLTTNITVNGVAGREVCIIPEYMHVGIPTSLHTDGALHLTVANTAFDVSISKEDMPHVSVRGFSRLTIGMEGLGASAYYDARARRLMVAKAYTSLIPNAHAQASIFYIAFVFSVYWYTCKYGATLHVPKDYHKWRPLTTGSSVAVTTLVIYFATSAFVLLLAEGFDRRLREYTALTPSESSVARNVAAYTLFAVCGASAVAIGAHTNRSRHAIRLLRGAVESTFHTALLIGSVYMPEEGTYTIIAMGMATIFVFGRIVDTIHFTVEMEDGEDSISAPYAIANAAVVLYAAAMWTVSVALPMHRKHLLFFEPWVRTLVMTAVMAGVLVYVMRAVVDSHIGDVMQRLHRKQPK